MYNNYINGLFVLRKEFENRIDNEIEECMRGRGNSARLLEGLEYLIEESNVLHGSCKNDECQGDNAEWKSREQHNDFKYVECSKCGCRIENIVAVKIGKSSTDFTGVNYRFCPRCGSRMSIRR